MCPWIGRGMWRSASTSQLSVNGCILTTRENPKKNAIVQEYVLPDHSGSTSTTGYIRSGPNAEAREGQTKKGNVDDEEQVLWMGNERFMGPELLFNPSDIGTSILKSRG